MKNVIVLFIGLLPITGYAQKLQLGVRGGVGLTKLYTVPPNPISSSNNSDETGFGLSPQLAAELSFNKKKWRKTIAVEAGELASVVRTGVFALKNSGWRLEYIDLNYYMPYVGITGGINRVFKFSRVNIVTGVTVGINLCKSEGGYPALADKQLSIGAHYGLLAGVETRIAQRLSATISLNARHYLKQGWPAYVNTNFGTYYITNKIIHLASAQASLGLKYDL
jgi:hypothetical protein